MNLETVKKTIAMLIQILGVIGLVYVLNPIFKEHGYGLWIWIIFLISLRAANLNT